MGLVPSRCLCGFVVRDNLSGGWGRAGRLHAILALKTRGPAGRGRGACRQPALRGSSLAVPWLVLTPGRMTPPPPTRTSPGCSSFFLLGGLEHAC